jgi:hypothetical protein
MDGPGPSISLGWTCFYRTVYSWTVHQFWLDLFVSYRLLTGPPSISLGWTCSYRTYLLGGVRLDSYGSQAFCSVELFSPIDRMHYLRQSSFLFRRIMFSDRSHALFPHSDIHFRIFEQNVNCVGICNCAAVYLDRPSVLVGPARTPYLWTI